MRGLLNKQEVRTWLAIVGASTLIIGGAYTMVQQSTRLTANDLPSVTAQVVKNELESGSAPSDVIPAQNVNLRNNDNVFVIVTDADNHVLASSATLDSQSPLPPKGVFAYTTSHGRDHFTWQPADKVRLATVVMSYSQASDKGFVITGQSLRPAEERIATYGWLALAAWTAVLAWTFLILILPARSKSR